MCESRRCARVRETERQNLLFFKDFSVSISVSRFLAFPLFTYLSARIFGRRPSRFSK